jgi:hypothetical protein
MASFRMFLILISLSLFKSILPESLELDSLVLGSAESNSTLVKASQSRIWTSFIETISATGVALDPAIIFKEKALKSQLFLDEFKTFANWFFITSEIGWTDNEIAVA